MRPFLCLLSAFFLAAAASDANAQPDSRPGGPAGRGNRDRGDIIESSVAKMMKLDTDGDAKLTQSEVSDARLQPLFGRADADHDGTVTHDELKTLFTREAGSAGTQGGSGFRGAPNRGPGGRMGAQDEPGGFRPGRSGPGGPQVGQVLPPFLQEELQLTDSQRAQMEQLQKDVDARLAKILTEQQRQRLSDMSQRGPGGAGRGRREAGDGPARGPGNRPQRPVE